MSGLTPTNLTSARSRSVNPNANPAYVPHEDAETKIHVCPAWGWSRNWTSISAAARTYPSEPRGVEALKELAAPFDAEVAPMLVEVEGQTLRLEGSAETQYAEWRRLLNKIFAAETGLSVDPDDSVPTAEPTAVEEG